MEDISKNEASAGLKLLADTALDRKQSIENYSSNPIHPDSDEENGSDCRIFDSFYAVGGSTSIHSMTNYNAKEFQKIWDNLRNHITQSWNVGRGSKCRHKPKDVLFTTLCVLKHGGHWDFLARSFKMKGPTFERMISGFIQMLSDHVYQKLVIDFGAAWSMTRLTRERKTFSHFPCSRYAVDVTFQQANRPTGTLEEAKKYYIGKHKLYGYKVEVSVLPCGLAAFCSAHSPGSVSDIDILASMIDAHEEALRKNGDEVSTVDVGPLHSKYPDYWAGLADKGYQGAIEFLRLIHPKKKPINGLLTIDEEANNKDMSSDRVIVENLFGRLCGLWDVLSRKYRWSEYNYDTIFKVCLGLANLHILWHPLRADDCTFYQKHRNRQYSIGDSMLSKRREKQRCYHLKRKCRLNVQFHALKLPGSGSSDDDVMLSP